MMWSNVLFRVLIFFVVTFTLFICLQWLVEGTFRFSFQKLWQKLAAGFLFSMCALMSVFAILVHILHRKYIFQASGARPDALNPMHLNLNYTEDTVYTDDGCALSVWWSTFESNQHQLSSGSSSLMSTTHMFPASKRPTILFFHGNGGNMNHRVYEFKRFLEYGFNVCMFDYRGYGSSTGKPTESGLIKDGVAIYNYVHNVLKIHTNDIILVGRSLGGGVATATAEHLAKKEIYTKLVLQCTFTKLHDVIEEISGFLKPYMGLISVQFDNVRRLHDMPANKVPILVMHAVNDSVVPFKLGQKLGTIATEKHALSRFVPLPHGGHNDCYQASSNTVCNSLKEFVLSFQEDT